MTSNDERFHDLLQLELDGELGDAARRDLERELEARPELGEEREQLGRLVSMLSDSRIDVRPGFRESVMDALPAAGWEARHPRSWAAALVVLGLLGSAAAVLTGLSAANLEAGSPFLGAVSAVIALAGSSILAGAGLLTASWTGLGLAVGELLEGSMANTAAFVALVGGVNYLLYRLIKRGRSASVTVAAHEGGANDRRTERLD